MINKHKSNKIKENSNTVRHLNNGTDHRHSKSCCDQSSPARRTINLKTGSSSRCIDNHRFQKPKPPIWMDPTGSRIPTVSPKMVCLLAVTRYAYYIHVTLQSQLNRHGFADYTLNPGVAIVSHKNMHIVLWFLLFSLSSAVLNGFNSLSDAYMHQ